MVVPKGPDVGKVAGEIEIYARQSPRHKNETGKGEYQQEPPESLPSGPWLAPLGEVVALGTSETFL